MPSEGLNTDFYCFSLYGHQRHHCQRAAGSTSNKAKPARLADGDFGALTKRRNQMMEIS
tara:strand:+ start:165 stop:341 length:177 start_codon:yes stop_codon:yes gene_type:complete